MEKCCKSCGKVFNDLTFKICPYCGSNITEEEVGDLGANYTKINETVYLYNYTIAGDTINDDEGKELGKMIDVHNFDYGEYIKIDGKTYLVHTSGKPTDPDYDKCLEYLTYFNEHNTLETVKIF